VEREGRDKKNHGSSRVTQGRRVASKRYSRRTKGQSTAARGRSLGWHFSATDFMLLTLYSQQKLSHRSTSKKPERAIEFLV